MIRILHAADLHLDSAFAGLPPEKARQRRRESRELPARLAALAAERRADLVLLSGDLFDGERIYPETLETLAGALAAMACPVFIAPGNHDPATPRSPYALRAWPENVHIFRRPELEAVELPELGCVVHGAAFLEPSRTDEILAGFAAPADGRIHLLCLHGEVAAAAGSSYGPISRQQIADSGLDYLALGHIHQCSGLQRQGNSFWAYPGCPEGRGFDELGEKGVLFGTVERGRAEMDFIPLCRRRYQVLPTDVTERSPADALAQVLRGREEDVCRVVFTGETGAEGVDLRALADDFSGACFSLELRDETCLARDIWEKAEEDSLRGLFLRDLRARYGAAESEEERRRIVSAVHFGLAALDGRDRG